MYYLFVKQVQGKLKSNCFHVGFLQSGGNVHVHVQESLHGTPLFGLFNLQLRQKIDKPFKRSLITIDPKKVDLKLEGKLSNILTEIHENASQDLKVFTSNE